eukprot:TRINITY_DN878_c0_g3_i2.p1 TRINITY_DN878_c0_g3~~TRINITY_DN878_c0_g3_i2.p1  ORF type:complete len:223 (-),score=21.64 TRINITY_DN878_c0_g3_i2:123-791(-)
MGVFDRLYLFKMSEGHHEPKLTSAQEHQVKAELIQKLSPYYHNEPKSVLQRILSIPSGLFGGHGHGHGLVNTSGYEHPSLERYSEREIVGRTVFALHKINALNHHFFSAEERRILNSQPTGLISRAFYFGCAGFDGVFLGYMFRHRDANPRLLALFGGLLVGQYLLCRSPVWLSEQIQWIRRRRLAKEYLAMYSPEFFHEVNDPRTDDAVIASLHNKRHAHH